MKKTGLLLFTLFTAISGIWAQAPAQFKYQAVLRDAGGNIISNQSKTVLIKILESNLTTSVFTETHSVTTTDRGLINLNIGSIEDLSVVDWAADNYFIEVSVDGTIMGTSRILSVPYAIQAKEVEHVDYSQITNTPTLFDGNYNSLSNLPTLFDGNYNSLSNLPTLFSGDYGDLTNTPTLFDGKWSSLTGTVPNISIFSNNVGYLTSEVDGSVTNEIELPTQTGNGGKYLTTNGTSASWQTLPSSGSVNVVIQNNDYTIQPTDGCIIADGGNTYTLPTAAAAGEGKILYIYVTGTPELTLATSGGDLIWDAGGNSGTSDIFYSGVFVSDGVSAWYQVN